tara:strand:- start:178 stop:795 length:618 start_codon:yes stop_codon:yes gene_type:complete
MRSRQYLYLVFGGFLDTIGKERFSRLNSLEYVGIYENLEKAKIAWKSHSIKNIDFANKKYKIVPLFNFFDPTERIIDYIIKLKSLKIKIDTLTFSSKDTLLKVCKKLKLENAGAGVVIDKYKIKGIVTEKDIIKTIASSRPLNLTIKLDDFMTKKVIYLDCNDTLINAIELLKKNKFRHLPIFNKENKKFYGIISYKDFMLGNLY